MMAGRNREAWNDEDVDLLRELARAEIDITGIARRLERTREAVYTKARKLGVKIAS
jgi:transcriptional regulator with GAF, ATPase, and Fis domain